MVNEFRKHQFEHVPWMLLFCSTGVDVDLNDHQQSHTGVKEVHKCSCDFNQSINQSIFKITLKVVSKRSQTVRTNWASRAAGGNSGQEKLPHLSCLFLCALNNL